MEELQRQAGDVLDDVRAKRVDMGEEVSEELEERIRQRGEKVLDHIVRQLEVRVGMRSGGGAVRHRNRCTCTCACVPRTAAQSAPTPSSRARASWCCRG